MSDYQAPPKKGRIQKIKDFVKKPTERIEDAYGVMREVGGFIPMFNIRDLEQRRQEVKEILELVEGKIGGGGADYQGMKDVVQKTYRLFFLSGSPWIRGLNNRELSDKVSKFGRLFNDIGHLPEALSDLFMCSMQLLHVSYQAIDVTNTPAYVIHTTPVLTPSNVPRINMRTGETDDASQQQPPREETV